jgi:replicative DNA helicase
MKALRSNMYKDIASILISSKPGMKTNQVLLTLTRAVQIYPSKSIYCLVANRMLHFIEKNILSIDLILEVMKEEGEDEEIVTNIEFLRDNPSINTQAEVTKLCKVLIDYIRWHKILKAKDSWLKALDIIDDETNIKNNIETVYKISQDIVTAYNSSNISETSHTFDTSDAEGMKHVIAQTLDVRKPDKTILTSMRGLNSLLSPGYLSGCLYVYAGLPGNYKSGMLLQGHIDTCRVNEHIKNTTNGKTPVSVYVTMENSMAQTVSRLWSLLYPSSDMSIFSIDEIDEMIRNALGEKGIRSVLLYYGYREKSATEIGQILQSYNDDNNEVVALYLDYIKRLRPHRQDAVATSSEKLELGVIMNELKTIAIFLNIPIITGHQLNRTAAAGVDAIVQKGGYNKTDEAMGRSMIANSLYFSAA